MEIIEDSSIMQNLPWAGIMGNALQYLREAELPSGSFFDANEIWTEETGRVYQVTAGIKIMGKDADVDNFLQSTRSTTPTLRPRPSRCRPRASSGRS
jgi:ATP-dependent protease ClpP protease subunit